MTVKAGRIRVHFGGKSSGKTKTFCTGAPVQQSGIYRVIHPQHRLPTEVTLHAEQAFPRCCKCSEPVYFEFAAARIETGKGGFRIMLYELPEVADQNESLVG
jgi:hypothetical protein